MTLEHSLSRLWWTKNIRYFVYFVREFSGVVIALYTLYLLYMMATRDVVSITGTASTIASIELNFINSRLFHALTGIALMASLFHSISWFYVMAKLTPVRMGGFVVPQFLTFALIMLIWVGVMYGLLYLLY